jgi:hypothetical protein
VTLRVRVGTTPPRTAHIPRIAARVQPQRALVVADQLLLLAQRLLPLLVECSLQLLHLTLQIMQHQAHAGDSVVIRVRASHDAFNFFRESTRQKTLSHEVT